CSRPGNPYRRERRRRCECELILLAQLEQREERDGDLRAREPQHLLVEVEQRAATKQRPPALEELRDRRKRKPHVRGGGRRRLDREQTHRRCQRQRVLGCNSRFRPGGRERRRTQPEEARLHEPLPEPDRRLLRPPVLGEPARELLCRLLRLELAELGLLLGEETAGLQLEQRRDQDEELTACVEV